MHHSLFYANEVESCALAELSIHAPEFIGVETQVTPFKISLPLAELDLQAAGSPDSTYYESDIFQVLLFLLSFSTIHLNIESIQLAHSVSCQEVFEQLQPNGDTMAFIWLDLQKVRLHCASCRVRFES